MKADDNLSAQMTENWLTLISGGKEDSKAQHQPPLKPTISIKYTHTLAPANHIPP